MLKGTPIKTKRLYYRRTLLYAGNRQVCRKANLLPLKAAASGKHRAYPLAIIV